MNKLRLFIVSIFLLLPMLLFAQQTVSGVVTDQSGEPLPGVNVTIQGTNQGTATDFDGKYLLENVVKNIVLEFSFMGFDTQVITVTSNKINVTMVENSESLDEVLIIGYGTTAKKDATGSVSKISAKEIEAPGVVSAQQALVGKIAGVTVTPSGAPGGGGVIRIRESTSLNAGQDPLIVIDGVPISNEDIAGMRNPLNSINPNDIESYTVLKDASSTAIYGSRASNGVILITTKKGKSGDIKVAYNYNYTSKNLIKQTDVLSASEYTNFVTAHGSEDQIALLGTANTDWQAEIFERGHGMNHDLSLTGGTTKINYRFGLGFSGEDGILKTSSIERGTYSMNLGSKVFKDKLKIDLSYRISLIKNRFGDTGAISSAISYDPTQTVFNEDDSFGGYTQWLESSGNPVAVGAPANPLALLLQKHNISSAKRGIGNIKFDYQLPYIDGLHANLVLGMDNSTSYGTNETDRTSWSTYDSGHNTNYGNKSEYSQESTNKLLDFYLNYSKTSDAIKGKMDFVAGYSYQDFTQVDYNTSNLQGDPNSLSEDSDFYKPFNLQSFFGRLNYAINNKYLLTATFRRDGTSRFYHSNNTWIDTPSAAFAWKISEENFLQDSNFISNLKLRLGWGVIGQQDIDIAFPGLPTYLYSTQTAQYQFGDGFIITARPQPYNSLLQWENTTTYNFGLDYGILDNKIDGTIELFYRLSDDLLSRLPFPAGSSLSNEDWANIGNLENKGVEFTINSKLITKDDFNLNVSVNATYNTLEITKLRANDDSDYQGVPVGGFSGGVGNNIQIQSVGYSPYSFYVYEQVYDTQNNPIEGVYVDRNDDGVIDSNDKYRYKKPNADVTFGFNTNLNYKKLDFNMFWRGSVGNFVYNNVDSQHGFQYQMLNESFNVINNGVQDVVDSGFQNGGTERYMSDYYIQDASFAKLENVSLGYTFDEVLSISKVRLYGAVQNAYIFTNYTGSDPEVFGGIDYNLYPRPRTYVMGLNINF